MWHELKDLAFFGLCTSWHELSQNEPELVTNALVRLIPYIHHTSDHRPHCHVGDTAHHCRWCQDSDFAVEFQDSLDAGLRMDGITALDLWDLVDEVLHSSPILPVRGDPWRDEPQTKHANTKTKKHVNRVGDAEIFNVDHVNTNAKLFHVGAFA